MTDEEAAASLGIGTHKFAEWRREEGLKPNRKPVASQGGDEQHHRPCGAVRKH